MTTQRTPATVDEVQAYNFADLGSGDATEDLLHSRSSIANPETLQPSPSTRSGEKMLRLDAELAGMVLAAKF